VSLFVVIFTWNEFLFATLLTGRFVHPEEWLQVIDFMVAVGLPMTFEEIGIGDVQPEELMELAEVLCGPDQITHNHVFTVTPFDLYSAMVAADALGHSRRALAGLGLLRADLSGFREKAKRTAYGASLTP
jgi:hypothetical protein